MAAPTPEELKRAERLLAIEKSLSDAARDQRDLLTEINRELGKSGYEWSKRYDWSNVAHQIENVYEMVSAAGEKVSLGSDLRGWMRSN
jgi:glycosyltransferase involved in cell wall biosynthesis